MGALITAGSIKYVFTQAVAPSGEGEVEGSLWYNTTTKILSTYNGTIWVGTSVPAGMGHITIQPWNYQSITQGTYIIQSLGSNQYATFGWINSSDTQNDEVIYNVFLAAGTYSLRTMMFKYTGQGIVSVYLDATIVGTIDGYSASVGYNVFDTITGITVAADGLYSLKLKMATKNGSSSGYLLGLSGLALWRTA